MSKYHAKKVLSMDGIEFDSKLEAKRWDYLRGLQEEGKIWDLERQVEFVLIPKQEKPVIRQMKRKVKIESRLGEHPVSYVADFVYKTIYRGPVAYDPEIDSINYYTVRGDMVYYTKVEGCPGQGPAATITDVDVELTIVEDTKGFKTPDYILKRKMMRYYENVAIREVSKPYEEI